MKKTTWREYRFADGCVSYVRKYSASELRTMERVHGKCLSCVIIGIF